METHLIEVLRSLLGLILGGSVGLGFGLIQQAAHRRNARRQDDGKLSTGWAVMPGSLWRVACLLVALALIQAASPALFAGASAWWVSAGVALGYGVLPVRHLWRIRAATGSPLDGHR